METIDDVRLKICQHINQIKNQLRRTKYKENLYKNIGEEQINIITKINENITIYLKPKQDDKYFISVTYKDYDSLGFHIQMIGTKIVLYPIKYIVNIISNDNLSKLTLLTSMQGITELMPQYNIEILPYNNDNVKKIIESYQYILCSLMYYDPKDNEIIF